ncbi:MAG: tRNA (adenosine(37)-N6)-dimethylallyltransferase MiaA [Deltaproteobacteria bacterium]|nr:tRNA (adenosine(37)-N6)-dimethylallyltransferase MiaA [Deltaproteobacteria bacterium]
MTQPKTKIVCVVGPTATGKTTLGINIASAFNGEIINADSRQFYKELVIGTAKPSAAELNRAAHHLIDCASITRPWTVADFVGHAKEVIDNLTARGKLPVVVGGTGMYIKSLLFGLDPVPKVDENIQCELQGQLEGRGLKVLYEELKAVDPQSAERLSPNDTQRIIRALGVYRQTGRPLHEFWQSGERAGAYDCITFASALSREILYRAINLRVEKMMALGLKQEALALINRYPGNQIIQKTIGYAEWLQIDSLGDQGVLELIKKNTRHFAKRQLTWFKNMSDVIWADFANAKSVMGRIGSVASY